MRGFRYLAFIALTALLAVVPLWSNAESSADFSFGAASLDMAVGETISLSSYLRGTAQKAGVSFASSDPAIVRVDAQGTAEALSEGLARITARSANGLTASLYVRSTSAPPKRRALILSEQWYLDGRVRTGAVNTAQGMADMLNALRYRTGANFEVTVRVDSTEDDINESIAEAFGESQSSDTSLFYVNCHGEMRNGEACLILHDGTALSVRRLEEMLRSVRGRVIVLIDCCGSGAFIGRAASRLYAEAAAQCFKDSPLLSGKYLVMTSCGSEQDSYRLSDSGEINESSMATVFARSVCEGLGWDLDRDRGVSLRADANRDGVVTFTELWTYARRRVKYHLSGTGAEQTVMAWPEINEGELFARQT